MKQIIVICNLETLEKNRVLTSSSKYECQFAFNMASMVDKVSIVSPKAKIAEQKDNIELIPVKNINLINDVKNLSEILENILSPEDDVVIQFFGYNPKLIAALLKLKKNHRNIRLSSVVYDTHLGVLADKSILKKALVCFYYNFGLIKLRKIDKIILFKNKAKKRMKIKNETLTIKPDVNPLDIKSFRSTGNKTIRFLYAGTLCEYNCIEELIKSFSLLNRNDAELEIYGDGTLKSLVEKAAEDNKNIKCFGRIENSQLQKKIAEADVMINLRKVPSIINDYAFPSKIVEYMEAGKAVISTNVSDNEEYRNAVFLVEPLREKELVSMLEYICDNKNLLIEKVSKSREYLEKYHNSNTIKNQIYNYLF